jgi:GNAT superfamily N-acetyltransferase
MSPDSGLQEQLRRAGLVVGFADCGPSQDADLPARAGEVHGLYTHPQVWGRGAGSALLTDALTHLTASGYDLIVVWTLDGNKRTLAFYAHHHLTPDGARHPHHALPDGSTAPTVPLRRTLAPHRHI